MWVKKYCDGTVVEENRKAGHTWLRTPQENIHEVYMINEGRRSPGLTGFPRYWHSRTGVIFNVQHGIERITKERIQGQRDDGRWETVEWIAETGEYIQYVADKAIGLPVYK